MKQFGDFSLGEIAVAAVSKPGSNYSKVAEIEFRRREVVIQIETLEAQKAVAEVQKAVVEAQKALAEAQKAAALPLRLTGWGIIGLAAATFMLALLTAWMDRWRPPAAGLVGYLPDHREKTPSSLPFGRLELLKASESLLKQNAAASPIGHFASTTGKLFCATFN